MIGVIKKTADLMAALIRGIIESSPVLQRPAAKKEPVITGLANQSDRSDSYDVKVNR
jgi:hypothetical protein